MEVKIFSVIVTFNPKVSSVIALLNSLRASGVTCCVVDNSDGSPLAAVANLAHLIVLDENKGIAAAQNIGVEACIRQGADRIVFFDQDSIIDADFIPGLSSAFSDSSVRISAPVFSNASEGFEYPLVDVNRFGVVRKRPVSSFSGAIDVSTVISSGTMVDASVFFVVGNMDERLFIDYVDTEWCFRCMRSGLSIRVNPGVCMLHTIGDKTLRFGFFAVPIHSPVRRYYRVRNSLLLLRYRHVPLLYSLREIAINNFHQAIIFLFVKNRVAHLRCYLRAISDGVRGGGGRLGESVLSSD